MKISDIFFVTATLSSVILIILSLYISTRFIKTLDEIELFLKDMRHLTADVHNAPRKVGSNVLGMAANVLQFFLGRG